MDDEERRKQEYLEYKKEFQRNFLIFYKGRMKRREYFLLGLLLGTPLALILSYLDIENNLILTFVWLFIALFFSITLNIKRFHDIGFNGWFVLPYMLLIYAEEICQLLGYERTPYSSAFISVCTIIALVISFVLIFCPSQKQDNPYGRYYTYSYL